MNRFDIIELAQSTMQFVYDTFNGKVNNLDPYTRLNFILGYLDKTTNVAKTTPYGYIYISLDAFADLVESQGFIDTDQLRNLALEIVLHELTHVNQLIDYRYIKFNNGYREDIEKQCVKQTCKYILDNIDMIRSFGLVVIPDTYIGRLNALDNIEFDYKNPDVLSMIKLESVVGTTYKQFNHNNIVIHYIDMLKNHYEFDVCKDRVFINSQNLNDLGERLLNNKDYSIEYFEYDTQKLEIRITQGV